MAHGATYRERLWPGPGLWICCLVAGAALGLVVWPASAPLAPVVGVLTTLLLFGCLVLASPVVEVAEGELRAGRAHIPLDQLGSREALDAEATRAALGPDLDARAFVLVRGWVPSGVRLEVVDPRDPTPYWFVSTRRPDRLLAALGT
jgi:Protein of unknown function (DUF3093).